MHSYRKYDLTENIPQLLVGILTILLSSISNIASAQSDNDFDPPELTHNVPEKLSSGDILVIFAKITDNVGVEKSTLYYRSEQNGPYDSVELLNSSGDDFEAGIEMSGKEYFLQYYFDIADTAGNRILEGSPDSPLTFQLSKRSTAVYVAVGAIAVGGVALLLGGGTGGGSEDANGNRTVTINATVPE